MAKKKLLLKKQDVALINKALTQSAVKDPLEVLLTQVRIALANTAPEVRRITLDMVTGDATLEMVTHTVICTK